MSELNGLSTVEAGERLAKHGKNALPESRFSLLKLILRQFKGIFNILLPGSPLSSYDSGDKDCGVP